MASRTEEKNGGHEADARSGDRDFKWAVEWLVRQQGQRKTAEVLGVNRKTVALALRRERLTGRMNHAVQTLLANLDDPVAQEVMPLDRIESQVGLLLESVDELDRLVEDLVRRVVALESPPAPEPSQRNMEAEGDTEAVRQGEAAVWGKPPTGCDKHDLSAGDDPGTENRTDGKNKDIGGHE